MFTKQTNKQKAISLAEITFSQSASLVDPDNKVPRDMIRAALKASQDDMVNKLKAFYEAALKIHNDRIEHSVKKSTKLNHIVTNTVINPRIPRGPSEDIYTIVLEIAKEIDANSDRKRAGCARTMIRTMSL